METVEKIQSEINALSYPDFKQILHWINEKEWKNWDKALEEDVDSGKLDFLVEEAVSEKQKGFLKAL